MFVVPSPVAADTGWLTEEAMSTGRIDDRQAGMKFDNSTETLFSFWDSPSSGFGGGYSIRKPLGPTSSPISFGNMAYLSMRPDASGNVLMAWQQSGKIKTGLLLKGTDFIFPIQDLGNTVPYNAGRTVDIAMTDDGLGAIIWMDSTGRPKVAFRPAGDNTTFDVANALVLDTPPSSSAGSVFISRDKDGAAFAVWRRDSQYKQVYIPTAGAPTFTNLTFVVPVGPPPISGKINSGSVLSFSIDKNSSGDTALAYAIYTSTTASAQPFNSISLVRSYRKHGQITFGAQSYSMNPDDLEDNYTEVAVMPDGRPVVAWLQKKLIPNPCSGPGEIGGPYIYDNYVVYSSIADANGENWQTLSATGTDSKAETFAFPLELAVANGRVVVMIEKNSRDTQCLTQNKRTEFKLVRALWPSSGPSFTNGPAPIDIPGVTGFGAAPPAKIFSAVAAIGVSETGTTSVLATYTELGVDKPSVVVWESGQAPSGPGTTPSPTPTPGPGSDNCPSDSNKLEPGVCGCGIADVDANANGITDCKLTEEAAFSFAQLKAGIKTTKLLTGDKKKDKKIKTDRAKLKALAKSLMDYVNANAAGITVKDGKNLTALASAANKAVNALLKANAIKFKAAKSKATKAVTAAAGAV